MYCVLFASISMELWTYGNPSNTEFKSKPPVSRDNLRHKVL